MHELKQVFLSASGDGVFLLQRGNTTRNKAKARATNNKNEGKDVSVTRNGRKTREIQKET